ncbi:MAG: T9SS type A sorting domain-containing protein [candidate division Zixibacteria bacterium]|nr:T9SS type A sorting domain-containing protein [candidate division Zixibacteria bacterium]
MIEYKKVFIGAFLLLLLAGNVFASNNSVLIAVNNVNSQLAQDYIDILDELGVNSTTTSDLYSLRDDLDAYDALFLLDYRIHGLEGLNNVINYFDTGGSIFFYGFDIENYTGDSLYLFFESYLGIGWTTCEVWPFISFSGASGTVMEGYQFGFPQETGWSTLSPLGEIAEVLLMGDGENCGCVAVSSTTPEYKHIYTDYDLEHTVIEGYPNTRIELFYKIAEFFGIEVTGVDDDPEVDLPVEISVMSNYPNPFNSNTTIKFSGSGIVRNSVINIYSINGSKVRELALSKSGDAAWDGCDENGNTVPSGIYFARYSGDDSMLPLKLTLIK